MKTKTVATAALIAILLAVVATTAFASTGQFANTSQSHNQGENDHGEGQGHDLGHGSFAACNNLTVGETLTVSGLTGRYVNASNHEMSGNASGTFTFTVSAKYVEGCTLTISSGSFKLGSTTYTVTGGSIILNHGGRSGEGSGTTSGGSFLINIAGLHGGKSADTGAVRLDFKAGSSEFLVQLHSPAAPDDEAGESD